MSEEDKDKELPWLYRLEPVSATAGEPGIDPGDAVYRLYKNTRNPFLRRALAPSPEKMEPTATELQSLFRLLVEQRRYRIGPSNDEEPFQRRSLVYPPPPPTAHPEFQELRKLPAHPDKLPLLVLQFFDSVLSRLREHPEEFFDTVDQVSALAKKYGVAFRHYESYHTFVDWDDLMRTLEEISRYPAQETFDLFCCALFSYRELV